jgi:hypothetical protein
MGASTGSITRSGALNGVGGDPLPVPVDAEARQTDVRMDAGDVHLEHLIRAEALGDKLGCEIAPTPRQPVGPFAWKRPWQRESHTPLGHRFEITREVPQLLAHGTLVDRPRERGEQTRVYRP